MEASSPPPPHKDATADGNVMVVHTLVMSDRRRYLQSIASEVGVSFGAVQSILIAILGMPKVSATWVPQMLTVDQKRTQLNNSRYLLSPYEDYPCAPVISLWYPGSGVVLDCIDS